MHALFLDRDGVINVDHKYVYRKENFEFIDGIFELCQYATKQGYLIFVVTNQAGIGRGYYTERQFHELTKWMCEEFSKNNVTVEKVYFCPFHEKHGIGKYKKASKFRKPEPGMIFQAAEEFNLNLEKSILVGDKESDIQAGISAGIGFNYILNTVISNGKVMVVGSLLEIKASMEDGVYVES